MQLKKNLKNCRAMEKKQKVLTKENWDWKVFLEEDRIADEDEYKMANMKALGWPTCACGQLCKNLPRSIITGKPMDPVLAELGTRFYWAIDVNDIDKARTIFAQIEARTAKLLKKMKDNA